MALESASFAGIIEEISQVIAANDANQDTADPLPESGSLYVLLPTIPLTFFTIVRWRIVRSKCYGFLYLG